MRLAVCQDLQLLSIRVLFFFYYYYYIVIAQQVLCDVFAQWSITSKSLILTAVLRLIFFFAFVILQHCHPEVHGAEAFVLLA